MRERIEMMRVASVLGDQHGRLEAAEQRGHYPVEGHQPRLVPREGIEGQVGRIAFACSCPRILRKPGAREQPAAALVKADRKHLGVALKDLLHPIAVVDVDVDVGHAVATLFQPLARDRGVVVGAEARRAVAVRVVQSARRAEGVQRGAALDGLGCDERGAGDEGGALVQLVGDRIVRGGEARGVDRAC